MNLVFNSFSILSLLLNIIVVAMNPSTSNIRALDLKLSPPSEESNTKFQTMINGLDPDFDLKGHLHFYHGTVNHFAIPDSQVDAEIRKTLFIFQILEHVETFHDVSGDEIDGSFKDGKKLFRFLVENRLYYFHTIPLYNQNFHVFGTISRTFLRESLPNESNLDKLVLWTLTKSKFPQESQKSTQKTILLLKAISFRPGFPLSDALKRFKFDFSKVQ